MKVRSFGASMAVADGGERPLLHRCRWVRNYSSIKSLNTRQSYIHFMIVLYMLEGIFIGPQSSYFTKNDYFTPNSNIYIPFVLQGRSGHFALFQSSFFYLAIILSGNLVF